MRQQTLSPACKCALGSWLCAMGSWGCAPLASPPPVGWACLFFMFIVLVALVISQSRGKDGLHLVGVARKRATINIYLTNKVVCPSGISLSWLCVMLFKLVVHDVLSWLCMFYFYVYCFSCFSRFSERGEGRLAPRKTKYQCTTYGEDGLHLVGVAPKLSK